MKKLNIISTHKDFVVVDSSEEVYRPKKRNKFSKAVNKFNKSKR